MTDAPDVYRDSSGRTLEDYPRPSVAVDTAVLTVVDEVLQVVLTDSDGDLRLPGTFLHEGEVLVTAAKRALKAKVGLKGIEPQQLHVFDRPKRDNRGWVLSVAHVAVVASDRLTRSDDLRLTPIDEILGLRLKYDHADIVELAVEWIRKAYANDADPHHLLAEEFTLLELEHVHEAVSGVELSVDGFRRRMVRNDRVVETGRTSVGTIGKPARFYRRA
ncbi:NUDIX domain-containing protein [uncultured Amnibacterium sp.]|uniref:NUDIX hydrolase n=1 Tax=uncultured Amnibacterium sp. TaxID=1631851 RepID=UPI0035CAE402